MATLCYFTDTFILFYWQNKLPVQCLFSFFKAWKRHVSISFVKTDRIRLVNAPVKISDVLHQVLMRYFRDGAVKTARKHECFEYKTTGKLKCSPGIAFCFKYFLFIVGRG